MTTPPIRCCARPLFSRDTWDVAIHAYMGYRRDRLVVARELLTDSGSIFVQIGDERRLTARVEYT